MIELPARLEWSPCIGGWYADWERDGHDLMLQIVDYPEEQGLAKITILIDGRPRLGMRVGFCTRRAGMTAKARARALCAYYLSHGCTVPLDRSKWEWRDDTYRR